MMKKLVAAVLMLPAMLLPLIAFPGQADATSILEPEECEEQFRTVETARQRSALARLCAKEVERAAERSPAEKQEYRACAERNIAEFNQSEDRADADVIPIRRRIMNRCHRLSQRVVKGRLADTVYRCGLVEPSEFTFCRAPHFRAR